MPAMTAEELVAELVEWTSSRQDCAVVTLRIAKSLQGCGPYILSAISIAGLIFRLLRGIF